MPLKITVRFFLRFFFDPTKKMSVFRMGLSRANCRAASATPPKREGEFAARGYAVARSATSAIASGIARRCTEAQRARFPMYREDNYRAACRATPTRHSVLRRAPTIRLHRAVAMLLRNLARYRATRDLGRGGI